MKTVGVIRAGLWPGFSIPAAWSLLQEHCLLWWWGRCERLCLLICVSIFCKWAAHTSSFSRACLLRIIIQCKYWKLNLEITLGYRDSCMYFLLTKDDSIDFSHKGCHRKHRGSSCGDAIDISSKQDIMLLWSYCVKVEASSDNATGFLV